MTNQPVALIPHTRRRSSREQLAELLESNVPALEVRIASTSEETLDGLDEADILVTMGMEEEWYEHLEGIEWIQALSSGVNHYDLEAIEASNTVFTNAAGVHAEPIAQQVLGYMLLFERNLIRGIHQQEQGVWERYSGGELGDRTVGIVGLGAIGQQVATYAKRFGMEVVGTKRDPEVDIAAVDRVYTPDELKEVLSVAEYLVLACPLTDETRGLLDAEAIGQLPEEAVVINIARGGVVVEEDLIHTLEQDELRGAGLDVFEEEPLPDDSPLWQLSNVIITPHMAGSTPHYWERCVEIIAENVDPFVAGEFDRMRNRIL